MASEANQKDELNCYNVDWNLLHWECYNNNAITIEQSQNFAYPFQNSAWSLHILMNQTKITEHNYVK